MTNTVQQLFDLTGKIALVTGGARNLGYDMALALAEAGAGVAVTSRTRWDRCTVSYSEGKEWTHEEMATHRDDMFRAEDREFLAEVAAGRQVACGIDDARKSVEAIERAHAAAEP